MGNVNKFYPLFEDYKGKTLNNKIQHELDKYAFEQRLKANNHNSMFGVQSMVIIGAKKHGDMIKSVSVSKPNDLILNNFGNFWIKLFNVVGNSAVAFVANDITDTEFTYRTYRETSTNPRTYNEGGTNLGTQIGIGSGNTEPVRSNVDLETYFGSSPESTRQNTSVGGWNTDNGHVTYVMAITAGGSGTIRETATFAVWKEINGNAKTNMLTREVLDTPQDFSATDPISVKYTWIFI
jgi:hypothetical protein